MLISKLTNQFNMPKDWSLEKLGGLIAEAQPGFACGERDENGIVQLRMNNVDTRGNFVWDEYIRVPATEDLITHYQLEKDDVLFNNTNSTELVGKSAIFHSFLEPVVYSNHFTRLRTNHDKLLPEFLASWLVLNWQQGIFSQICNRWIGQSAVKMDKLLNLNIPLPPLSEQKRIVAILNEQMAAIEKARKAAEAQLEAALALPAAYLKEIFEGEEAKIWTTSRLGKHVTKIGSGITPRGGHTSYIESGIPLIRSQNVLMNRFSNDGLVFISKDQDEIMEPSRVFKGDVLLNITGASIGRVCIVPDDLCPANVNQHVSIIRTKDTLYPKFLVYYLRSSKFQKFIMEIQAGATRQALTKAIIENFDIPIPPFNTQIKVSEYLENKLANHSNLVYQLEKQLDSISALSNAILQNIFKGIY